MSGAAGVSELAGAAQATGAGTASAGEAGLVGKAINFANSAEGTSILSLDKTSRS